MGHVIVLGQFQRCKGEGKRLWFYKFQDRTGQDRTGHFPKYFSLQQGFAYRIDNLTVHCQHLLYKPSQIVKIKYQIKEHF